MKRDIEKDGEASSFLKTVLSFSDDRAGYPMSISAPHELPLCGFSPCYPGCPCQPKSA